MFNFLGYGERLEGGFLFVCFFCFVLCVHLPLVVLYANIWSRYGPNPG